MKREEEGQSIGRRTWTSIAAAAGNRFSPYVVVRMVATSPQYREDPALYAEMWTIPQVAALSTAELRERVADLGFPIDQISFLVDAQHHRSAWALGQQWLGGRTIDTNDEDFLCLAACELWKRWCPSRPSAEQVEDWMYEGYAASHREDHAAACAAWIRAWDVARSVAKPQMRTIDALEPVFSTAYDTHTWIDDLAMALHNTALDDRGSAERGLAVVEQMIHQFADDDARTWLEIEQAQLLFLLDRPDEGERMLRDVLAREPSDGTVHRVLATHLPPERAIAHLEEVLAGPVDQREDLVELLAELRLS